MYGKKDGVPKHKGFMKMTPKQKAVQGGMPIEVANKIGIPKKGSNEPMMNYNSFKSYNIKAGGSKNTGFKMKAGSDGPMVKNYGPMLKKPASEITVNEAKYNASSNKTKRLIDAGAPKEVINNSKKNDVKKFKENNGFTKTYKEAYQTRSKKYQDMDEATYIKQAKAYNKKEYNTEKPSDLTYTNKIYKQYGEKFEKRRAAQDKRDRTGVDKKRNEAYAKKKEASAKKKEATKKPKVGDVTKSEKAKGNLVVNEKLMKNAEKNQRVSKATVTEKKKPIGPKERTTVKKAKATKKAGVKDAKQKGYETRKDRRAAVSDARKSGRAGVKEARKDKRDLKKAEKNTRKRDKKEVKAAITDAKRAAKIDKLKSKKSTNKRSNKIDDLQAKRKLNSDEPLAKKYKNASQRKAVHASKAEQNKK